MPLIKAFVSLAKKSGKPNKPPSSFLFDYISSKFLFRLCLNGSIGQVT